MKRRSDRGFEATLPATIRAKFMMRVIRRPVAWLCLISLLVLPSPLVDAGSAASELSAQASKSKAPASKRAAAPTSLKYRLRTVDWEQPGFLADPPYLGNYKRVFPVLSPGTALPGKFRQAGGIVQHEMVVERLWYDYEASGSGSDSDFVAVVSIPWFGNLAGATDTTVAVLVRLDDRDPMEIPVSFRPGALFFNVAGRSLPFSHPVAIFFDLPGDEHVVYVSARGLPSPYLLVTSGVFSPPPKP